MRTFTLSFLLIGLAASMQAQSPVISNKHFSIGSYGRAGNCPWRIHVEFRGH